MKDGGSDGREVMNVEQAAAYLHVSVSAVYRYASMGEIPAFKLGGRWRFRRLLLEKWMDGESRKGMAKG